MSRSKLTLRMNELLPKCKAEGCNTNVSREGWNCRKHYVMVVGGPMKTPKFVDRAIRKHYNYSKETAAASRFRKWRTKSQGGIPL